MSDRAAEARAEAERRYPESWDHYNDEPVDDWGYSECQREAFCAGVVWADANPKPHTITREALGRIGYIARGLFLTPHDLEWYLGGIGIEVEDDSA